MDYLKIYLSLIEKAQLNNRVGYLELHHIVPRCIFGENLLVEDGLVNVNQDSNLVFLTSREHFVAHWILHRAFPKNKKLGLAFWAMAGMISPDHNRDYIPSSRAIEEARIAAKKARQIPVLQYDLEGNFISEFTSLNSASIKVGVVPNAIGQNLSGSTKSAGGFQWRLKTKIFSPKIEPYFIDNNGLPIGQFDFNGKLISSFESLLDAERKTGHSEGSIRASMNRGAKIKNTSYFFIQFNKHQKIPSYVEAFVVPIHGFSIPVVQISADGKYFINEFPSIVKAQLYFDKKRSHISDVCIGKRETALGFKWQFKRDYKLNLPSINIENAEIKIYSKPIAQFSLNGEFMKMFKNATVASSQTKCSRSNIISVIKGSRKSSGGYIWANVDNGILPQLKKVSTADNKPKNILMLDKESNQVLKEFTSISAAAQAVNGTRSNISACLNGRKKTASGYRWEFKK